MNTNSSLFGDLLDGRLEKEDEVHLHLDDNFLAGPVDTDAHIDDSLQQQASQWGHHSDNHINITDDAQDGKGEGGGVSPPKMVFNSLGVMELEHRFTGTQSITTPPSSNPTSFYSSEGGNEEESSSSSDDDDDADFIYEVDRHDHMYSTSNNNSNNRYQTNFLDTASSIIDNLPVFNNSGNYTGTTSRECNIDDLECMGNANSYRGGGREDRGRGREDSVSYESTSTRRYKKMKKKCMVGIVLLGLVGIVLGIYYGKGGTSSQQDNEKQFDRYYQIGSEEDGIVVSDGVELVEGMVSNLLYDV